MFFFTFRLYDFITNLTYVLMVKFCPYFSEVIEENRDEKERIAR